MSTVALESAAARYALAMHAEHRAHVMGTDDCSFPHAVRDDCWRQAFPATYMQATPMKLATVTLRVGNLKPTSSR